MMLINKNISFIQPHMMLFKYIISNKNAIFVT